MQYYLEKAFLFEETGYLAEALKLCYKCVQAFPEHEHEIVFEIAKMYYRNGRLEEALLQFLNVYRLTNDSAVIDFILDAYYWDNQKIYTSCYEENCAILNDYTFFFGNKLFPTADEIRFYPILTVQGFLYYFDKQERIIGCMKRIEINSKEEDCICLADQLLWQDDILMLEKLTRKKNAFMDNENALLLVYDNITWELFLQVVNLNELIEFDRIVLFDTYESLEAALISAKIPFPKFMISDMPDKINKILNDSYKKYKMRLTDYISEVEMYYKDHAENILKHVQERKPRILFITSRYTTALQYHARDFKKAADRLGLNTELLKEADRLSSGNMLLEVEKIAKFKPDILFLLDHFRFESETYKLGQFVCITWVQDPLDNVMDSNTPDKLSNRDIILAHYTTWNDFLKVGYDKRRVIDAPIPANPYIYKKYELTKQEKNSYSCDLCFVCHASDVEDYIQKSVSRYPKEFQTIFLSIFRGYQQYVLETGKFFYTEKEFQLYVSGALYQHYSINITDKLLELVAHDMHLVFNELLYRQVLVDWLLDAGYENIKLWGNGWMNDPKYEKYAMGPAENGETLSKIYQASKIVVGNNIHSTAAARAWESMLSGAFYMSNYIPPEADSVDIRKIMKIDEELVMFYGKEDFLSKVEYYLTHEEERLKMAEIGYKAASERMTYDILVKKVIEELPKRLELLQGDDADER